MTKLYSAEELKRMQAEDILPLADSAEMASVHHLRLSADPFSGRAC